MIFNSLGVNTSTRIINNIENSEVYSEEERVVGTWIDGKPLYRQVRELSLSGVQLNTNFAIANLGISDMEIISLHCSCNIVDSDGVKTAVSDSMTTFWYQYHSDTAYFSQSMTGRTTTVWTIYLTLEYTKTTDEPVEANTYFGDVYSTEETVVGTWINGKPIYQKTFATTIMNGNCILTSTSDAEELVGAYGYMINPSGEIVGLPTAISSNQILFSIYNSNLNMYGTSLYAGRSAVVTFRYTKITDEALVSTTALTDSYDEGVEEA